MPAAPAVKQLRAARPRQADDVLEVRSTRGERAHRRGVSETTPRGDETDDRQPAADLEAPVANVLMRDAVTGKVQRNAEQRGSGP